MRLKDYLITTDTTLPVFAAKVGLSTEGVRLIVLGMRHPRKKTMEKIAAATDNKVTPADFYEAAA